MAKSIMIQGTMSNAGKFLLRQDFAAYLNRMVTRLPHSNPRTWH